MVSKRFVLKNDVNGEDWVYDNGTYIDNRMMVELLNDLNEENEVLRKRIIDLEVEIYKLKEESLMRMDYDYIIKENTEMEMQISELKKEIRQLKEDKEYWIQRADLTEEEQQEVIEYLHAYHQGDVKNIKEMKNKFVEQKLSKEWDFYPYNNLRFIWEIDEKNNRSILHLKSKDDGDGL